MVLVEAMALGLPVVAGEQSGAVPWVVGDVIGLCDVRHPGPIFKALTKVQEPMTYSDLSAKLRSDMQRRFRLQSIADAYRVVYARACQEASKADQEAPWN